MAEINGTENGETLDGTEDGDVINGNGGDDTINGNGGDDHLRGGEGDDTINGGDGRDNISGGDGNDTIYAGLGDDVIFDGFGTDLIYGEEGDDFVSISGDFDSFGENATVYGGIGNDEVRYSVYSFGGLVDMGAGADLLVLTLSMQSLDITLGSGSDTMSLTGLVEAFGGSATVTDFEVGLGGDVIDFEGILIDFFDYDGFANPFGTGHLTLSAEGAGSKIEFKMDPQYGVDFTLYFPNVAVGDWVAANFDGYDPSGESTQGPPIIGTDNGETLTGTELGETIETRDGDDTVNALGGDDTIVVADGANILNGGDGDDVFLYDNDFIETDGWVLDDVIDGGAGTDTLRIIGNQQGYNITWVNPGVDLQITNVERLEVSGNVGLRGTGAQFGGFQHIGAGQVEITDTALFTLGGTASIFRLTFTGAFANADLSGAGVEIWEINGTDGDDMIIGPDAVLPVINERVYISVGLGDDTVVIGDTATTVISDGGNNTVTGGASSDSFTAYGDGDNVFHGGGGDDVVSFFGVGVNEAYGGAGDDKFYFEFFDSDDIFAGGDGIDTLVVESEIGAGSPEAFFDLSSITLPSDIEVVEVRGGVTMTVAQISGPLVVLYDGLNIADGGTVVLDSATPFVYLSSDGNTLDLTNVTDGFVNVWGRIGNDIVYAGDTFVGFSGGFGNDQFYGGADSDFFDGGDGNDFARGGEGNDQLGGGNGVDELYGENGNDGLGGGNGDDLLYGGAGNDELYGNDGNDVLDGGTGDDYMEGGAGNDVYYVDSLGDTILEFSNENYDIVIASIDYVVDRTKVEYIEEFQLAGSATSLTGSDVNDILAGNEFLDSTISGGGGADLIVGRGGNDTIIGGAGNDAIDGGDGVDVAVYAGNRSAYTITQNAQGEWFVTGPDGGDALINVEFLQFDDMTLEIIVTNPVIDGTENADDLQGTRASDTISGLGADDTITGGLGNDSIDGGDGEDTAVFSGNSGDYTITETAPGEFTIAGADGTDTLVNVEFAQFADTTVTLIDTNPFVTTDQNDTITLTSVGGNAIFIDGLAGSDTLDASGIFFGGNATEFRTYASDANYAGASVVQVANYELTSFEVIYGSNIGANRFFLPDYNAAVTLWGGDFGDSFFGGWANGDTFFGRGGNDTFFVTRGDRAFGGVGDDVFRLYPITTAQTAAVINGGDGTDLLRADFGATVDLAAGTASRAGGAVSTIVSIENVEVYAWQNYATSVEGNGWANHFYVNASFNDGSVGVYFDGRDGDDLLEGSAGADTLIGGNGNDTMRGGLGADHMTGGLGDDVYHIDSYSDTVVEAAGEGFDRIVASFNFSAGSLAYVQFESFALEGAANFLRGNQLDNELVANALVGSTLHGLGGNDVLIGGAGDDRLLGGGGNDAMSGGAGNDIYFVLDAGDSVTELAGEGDEDEVRSAIDYTLGDHVENLRLAGTASTGTGNALDNALRAGREAATLYGLLGNDALYGANLNDRLHGDEGDDFLYGFGGNDLLLGGVGDDILNGGAGNDALYGERGRDTLSGGDGDDLLYGGADNDQLFGQNGHDTLRGQDGIDNLRGGGGRDVLIGGADRDFLTGDGGADTFRFNTGDFAGLGVNTADRIVDFTQGDGDVIDLSGVDAIMGNSGDDAFTFIADAAFSGTAGELRWEHTGANTMIYMDVDGDGAADYAIRLDGTINLAETDFIL